MTHLFIFGLGYSAQRIRAAALSRGISVSGTGEAGDIAFDDGPAVAAALERASHVLSSVPPHPSGGDPSDGGDPVLDRHGAALERFASRGGSAGWLGYLSSTGIYGDTGGAWVDEASPTGRGRRSARAACDAAWLARGARVFRLPGIYGPGRSAFERIAAGKAQRIAQGSQISGQIFSRVHVEDIASAVLAAIAAGAGAPPGAYNIADDLPTSQNAVIEEACALIGIAPPPLVRLEDAALSEAARGFYTETRRVANGKAKRVLGWRPRYPTYREGLRAVAPVRNPASIPDPAPIPNRSA